MKYPEDLTFTARDLSTPLDIRETDKYKNVKKKIWDEYHRGNRKCEAWVGHLSECEEAVLEAVKEEGFTVNIMVPEGINFQTFITIRW